MGSNSEKGIITNLVRYWVIYIGLLSALPYVFGYLKSLYFLQSFNIKVAPTEVYSVASLFISGLCFLSAGIIIPLFILFLGYCYSHIKLSNKILLLAFFSIFCSFTIIFVLPYLKNIFPSGFEIFPYLGAFSYNYRLILFMLYLGIVALMVFSSALWFLRFNNRSNRLIFFILPTMFWFLFLFGSQVSNIRYVKSGASPAEFSQDPGMAGVIVTRHKIASESESAPEFGDRLFKTMGILLNRRDGTYYFLPGVFAQSESKNIAKGGISIVSEANVTVFIQLP